MQTPRNATQAFYQDKRNSRPGESIGGGFIVVRRGNGSGRLRMNEWPFEHGTYEDAEAEARRLSEQYPGKAFAVLQQVSPTFAIPEVLADHTREDVS